MWARTQSRELHSMVRKWQLWGISGAGEGERGLECQGQKRVDSIVQGARGSSWG